MFQTDLINFSTGAIEKLETYLLSYSVNITKFLLIIIVGKILISFALSYLRKYFKKSERLEETVEVFIYNIVSTLSWAVIIMVALSSLGIDITPIIAGFGVAGFAVGIALKDTLSNFVSGALILFYKPFRLGDVIKAAGIKGTVVEIGISIVVVKTEDNLTVIIPNSKVWGAPITNYSRSDVFIC